MSPSQDYFFNIPCEYALYAEPLIEPATEAKLNEKMPETYKLLRDIAAKEQATLSHLNQLPKGDIITEYLTLQGKKVDLVLHQQLAQINHSGIKCVGTHFGGSHLTFNTPTDFADAKQWAIQLLIKKHCIAIYCFIEVLSVKILEKQQQICAEIIAIGEPEQEQLIRASLQQQQQILKINHRH
jgi:hypothetical protein